MSKTMRFTNRIPMFFFISCALLTMLGYASVCSPSCLHHKYSVAVTGEDHKAEGNCSSSAKKFLKQFEKEGQLQLSLSDCLLIAMQRNFDIQLTQEELIQADAEITRARSAMFPWLGAKGSFIRFDEEVGFTLGTQFLPFIDQDIYKGGIVVRQPIFMGGRLNALYKAGQYSRDAKAQENRGIEQGIVFQVTRAYRTARVAEAFQKVATDAVNLLKAHEHDVAILVDKGANPEIDFLRTRTELANAHKDLNTADNAVDLARSALKNLLDIDFEEPILLTEKLENPHRPTGDLLFLTQLAISQHPELSAISFQIAAAEQALKAARGEYMPTIAVEGSYEYIQGDFRDLEGGYHWTVGIGAELPLWNWGKTAASVRKAKSQLAQIEIQREKTEDRIRFEVRQAYLNIGKAEKNIDAAGTALITAKEAYRLARAGYRAGEGTNTDVLDARTALSRAEANHIQALFDYNVAVAALQRAVGITPIVRTDIEKEEPAK